MSNPRTVLKAHPLPWQHTVIPGGRVVVFDAAGVEVPLFPMLDLLVQLLHEEAARTAEKPAAA